jgi:primosomal protein N' (replication factor Y) (superfamily II helicase)
MERRTFFTDVIVPLGVPNKYTYRVPHELNESVEVGKRVLVQFGKTRIYTAIIYSIHEQAPKGYEAKYIEAVLDDLPVVTSLQLKFWDWLSFYYCANPGDVMNAALPSGLKLSSTSHVQLNPDFNFEEADHKIFTEREHQVLDALHSGSNNSMDDLASLLGIKSVQPLIHNLLKKNAVVVYEEVKDKYKPKNIVFVRLAEELLDEQKLGETLNKLEKKAFKQAEALLYYLHLAKSGSDKTGEWIKKSELSKKAETSAISALVKKSIFIEQEFEVGRLLFEKSNSIIKQLSVEQESAYLQIKKQFDKNKPVLLHGVTGSGKTEIYIQLIKDALEAGRETLFLIPEIALTTQLITRLRAVFGELVGVYHSRFSENERVEIWNNVLMGDSLNPLQTTGGEALQTDGDNHASKKYKIILGARSSLFLPFHKLGLIIIDEEHDNSFKQHDPSPRYNARDSALYLASLHNASVVMGSATPSIESFYNAQQDKYSLVHLKNQYVQSGGTHVEVCDLNFFEQSNQMKTCLTQPLFEAIENALSKKEQVILFQNRRGFAPYTECKHCGHVPHCIQCDVSLIYHKHHQKLVCHYCGYSVSPPKTCPACGSNQLHFKGLGTEKIEEDIEILFPNAKVARMDLDSTRSKYAYKQLIDDFENGQVDILIGTQMVTKGLDFNNVSVVGILNADSILNFPDFRSFEKAYQLITQVRGRAGRSSQKGKVFIQTAQPKHSVIDNITGNTLENFYAGIIEERKLYHYPPFTRLMELNVVSKDVNEVNHLSHELLQLLKPHFGDNILGPEFPLVSKIKNQYYKRLLLKTNRQEAAKSVREKIFEAINTLHQNYQKWNFKIQVDVDPV